MRHLFLSLTVLLFTLLFVRNANSAVVWDGGDAVQTYKNGIKFGTNEIIKVDGNKKLLITDQNGVTNQVGSSTEADLLLNRSFEESYSGSDALSWTLTGATGTITTASSIDGSKHLSLSLSSTLSLSQEITATQYNPNVVSFSLWVKSSVTDLQLCGTLATVEQECVDYDGSDQWKKLQVLVTAPSSGAMGLKLKTLASTSGTVLVDAGEFSSDPLKFKNQEILTNPVPYTPTFVGFGTPSTVEVFYSQSGKYLNITGSVVSGTTTAATPTLTLPSGLSADISAISVTANTETLGIWQHLATSSSVPVLTPASASSGVVTIDPASPTILKLAVYNGPSNAFGFLGASSLWASGNRVTFNIKVPIQGWSANQSQILTANDVVSSDTINWQFKSTAIVDSDPVGTYNTYSKAGSSNSFTICGTAPTTLPNNNDGFYMYAANFGEAPACGANITRMRIKIGKGLKGLASFGFSGTNKSGYQADLQHVVISSSEARGGFITYDSVNGIAEFDFGTNYSAANTGKGVLGQGLPATTLANFYLHFAASKNPVISALDAVPRVDFSWENDFSARIANNGTATITSQSSEFISSVSRTAAGVISVTFTSGFFSVIPSISADVDHTVAANYIVESYGNSTAGVTIRTANVAGAATDLNISLIVQRQGSDYRSRGDAAAIISQPTCYIKDVKAYNVNPQAISAGDNTRDLNQTSGSCFFASLLSNQITLNSGTYKIVATVPSYNTAEFKGHLYDVSDSQTALLGSSAYPAANFVTESEILGQITIDSSKVFELRHFAVVGGGLGGLRVNNSSYGDNVYSQIAITKIK